MGGIVAQHATLVKGFVAKQANDDRLGPRIELRMALTKHEKPAIRLHYIAEWAERRHLRQADIVREIGVDKSNVSRWFSGALPSEENIRALAALFELDEPAALFRHPDEDWMARLLRGRSTEERERAKQMLELAFPPRAAMKRPA
jgi:transcriptional regulator with XRE-family HTH domain